jgi:4-amino-4-deoxy-L-arabinose transferase-like glycosyltransferase
MRRFPLALAGIVTAAVVLRILHTVFIAPETAGVSDSFWYGVVARNVEQGNGFQTVVGAPTLHLVPTASHPPAYPVAIAAALKLGITGDTGHRLLGALFGGLTVLGIGLLGRRAGGAAVGLVAAGIAAVHPLLITADGALLSETLYGPIVAFTLLAAWRLGEEPSVGRSALMGAGVGLATLTRSEALLLIPLLALPLAWRGGPSRRWLRLGATVACAAVVISPWLIRNWVTFDRPVLSTNDGALIAWANCDATYHGQRLGNLATECAHHETGNEAEVAAKQTRQGLSYARDHVGRLPVVLAARLAGTWSFYAPFRFADPGRDVGVVKAGVIVYWALLPFAVIGALSLRRRGGPLWVLLAPIVTVCLVALATYTSVRLRFLAEIPLVVLAGAGLVAVATRLQAARVAQPKV